MSGYQKAMVGGDGGDDISTDDNDSDVDLDLNELDPQSITASTTHTSTTSPRPSPFRRQGSLSRISLDFGRRIPLRNLRFGGRRRPVAVEGEELDTLVENGEHARRRQQLSAASEADDAPLLTNGHVRQPSLGSLYSSRERKWRKRRWPWESANWASRPTSSDSPAEGEADDNADSSTHRTIPVGHKPPPRRFPANAVSHAKYNAYSFLPVTLYNEFKFFLNMYFLLVALSQIIPVLRIGYLSTYVAPLIFVLAVTMTKEAWDDLNRRKRDREANATLYRVMVFDQGSGDGARKGPKVERGAAGKRGKRKTVEDGGLGNGEVPGEQEAPNASVSEVVKPSRDLKVGDVLVLGKDERVPADVVVLKSLSAESATSPVDEQATSESAPAVVMNVSAPDDLLKDEADAGAPLDNETTSSDPSAGGEAFIRTDQLDGETDWKLRLASPLAQTLPPSEYIRLQVTAGQPDKRVNDFIGAIALLPKQTRAYDPYIPKPAGNSKTQRDSRHSQTPAEPSSSSAAPPELTEETSAPLTIDNTAWANTVVASSTTIHAVIIYTGPQTRAALSTSAPRSKVGLLDREINSLTKILCILTATISLLLVALNRFEAHRDAPQNRAWYFSVLRFLILFSTIVPISLRVNLDMGKSVYAWYIHRDPDIPGTVVRTSTIPEDLGRIEFLLSDKTGTLTRNEMVLRKVHVGTVSYGGEAMEEVGEYVKSAFQLAEVGSSSIGMLFSPSTGMGMTDGAMAATPNPTATSTTRTRREIGLRVRDLVLALAICHNVTPTIEDDETGHPITSYQASSPDEIAIVQWTARVGLRLAHRDRKTITLRFTLDDRVVVRVEILNLFPFTSDSKRMGIIVRFMRDDATIESRVGDDADGEIVFFQKGADTVMSAIVASNDWLDEETANMAREGLRTLVIGRKPLSREQYAAFSAAYSEASLSLVGREAAMAKVIKTHLEHDLELLGVTGVEDKLQPHVKPSLELLRNAGVKIWMLTGDKVETARCVAVNSKLVTRGQFIHTIAGLKRKEAAMDELNVLHSRANGALLIDGESLALYLSHHREAFISTVVRLPAVIACRCSPTQKADLARLIRAFTKKRIACIGDGGNDVSMIQAADVGVGIVGKEGRQASLAADFSITQFAHLTKLLVWHGRNSYKRSAKLAQFVIHRGLLISVCQTVFSIASRFEPIALYRDWLLVGYATVYTMAPVFSLVLDMDVDEGLANLYPELYKELTLGRSLSYKTFFLWVGISIYQGVIIQGGAELLVPGFSMRNADTTHSSPGFSRMVALSFTVLVINELVMVAAEITTWHPVMVFSISGTAMIFFGSVPLLGGYFDLGFMLTLAFWWRFAAVSAASLVPVWGGKVIRRTVRPPSYRKVRGI